MPKIKNMGHATARFNEGVIVEGQAAKDVHGLIVSGSISVIADITNNYVMTVDNDHNSSAHVLKLLTDGNGSNTRVLEMEDGDGDIIFRARADGRFGFGPDGVDSMGAGTFVVGIDNSSHTSDIAISRRMQHLGDGDTYIDFPANDQMQFQVGGIDMIHMTEDDTQDKIVFNDGAADVDFIVKSQAAAKAIYLHSGNEVLHINHDEDSFKTKIHNQHGEVITVHQNGLVLNDDGHATNDFRIESDQVDHMLFVDSGNNKIGIGTSGPDRVLDILTPFDPQLRLTHTDGSKYVDFQATAAGDFAMTGSNSHASYFFTSAGHCSLVVQSDAADGDSAVGFSVDGGASLAFSLGVDDGDADKFKIGTSLIDNNTRLTIDSTGRVGIGTTSPLSLLHVNGDVDFQGGQKNKFRDVNSSITLLSSDYVIRCINGSAITLTLPAKSSSSGQILIIKDAMGNAGTNNITIDGDSSDTIDGSLTYVINQAHGVLWIMCDGINGWMILHEQ